MSAQIMTAAIAAIPSTIAAFAAVIAARRGSANRDALHDVRTATARVEHQTNGEMDGKIQRAVMRVFEEHRGQVTEAVMAESVRHLLDSIINPYPIPARMPHDVETETTR